MSFADVLTGVVGPQKAEMALFLELHAAPCGECWVRKGSSHHCCCPTSGVRSIDRELRTFGWKRVEGGVVPLEVTDTRSIQEIQALAFLTGITEGFVARTGGVNPKKLRQRQLREVRAREQADWVASQKFPIFREPTGDVIWGPDHVADLVDQVELVSEDVVWRDTRLVRAYKIIMKAFRSLRTGRPQEIEMEDLAVEVTDENQWDTFNGIFAQMESQIEDAQVVKTSSPPTLITSQEDDQPNDSDNQPEMPDVSPTVMSGIMSSLKGLLKTCSDAIPPAFAKYGLKMVGVFALTLVTSILVDRWLDAKRKKYGNLMTLGILLPILCMAARSEWGFPHSFITEWTSWTNVVVAARNFKEAMLAIANFIPVMVWMAFGGDPRERTSMVDYLRRTVMVGSIMRGTGLIYERVIELFEATLGKLAAFKSSGQLLKEAITDWVDRVQHELTAVERSKAKPILERVAVVDRLVSEGEGISRALSRLGNREKDLRSDVVNTLILLYRYREDVTASVGIETNLRPEPVWIHLWGEPGCGKSSIVPIIAQTMGACIGRRKHDTANLTYARSSEHEYWDGYANHPIIVYDDFGQKNDTENSPSLELFEIIRIVNSFPYVAHAASVSQKGKLIVEAQGVISTGNSGDFAVKSLQSPAAVDRRCKLKVEVIQGTTGELKDRRFNIMRNSKQGWQQIGKKAGFGELAAAISESYEFMRALNEERIETETSILDEMLRAVKDPPLVKFALEERERLTSVKMSDSDAFEFMCCQFESQTTLTYQPWANTFLDQDFRHRPVLWAIMQRGPARPFHTDLIVDDMRTTIEMIKTFGALTDSGVSAQVGVSDFFDTAVQGAFNAGVSIASSSLAKVAVGLTLGGLLIHKAVKEAWSYFKASIDTMSESVKNNLAMNFETFCQYLQTSTTALSDKLAEHGLRVQRAFVTAVNTATWNISNRAARAFNATLERMVAAAIHVSQRIFDVVIKKASSAVMVLSSMVIAPLAIYALVGLLPGVLRMIYGVISRMLNVIGSLLGIGWLHSYTGGPPQVQQIVERKYQKDVLTTTFEEETTKHIPLDQPRDMLVPSFTELAVSTKPYAKIVAQHYGIPIDERMSLMMATQGDNVHNDVVAKAAPQLVRLRMDNYTESKLVEMGCGVFINTTVLMFPHHYLAKIKELLENGYLLRAIKQDKTDYLISADRVADIQEVGDRRDLVLMNCGNVLRHKNLMRNVIPAADHGKFKGTNFQFVGLRRDDDKYEEFREHGTLDAFDKVLNYQCDGRQVAIRQHLTYSLDTVNGDCGALLIAVGVKSSGRIVGMHVAGDHDGQGYAVPLIREEIEAAMARFPKTAQMDWGEEFTGLSKSEFPPEGNFLQIGQVSRAIAFPRVSKIIPSPIHGWQPITSLPVKLTPFRNDERVKINPMELARQKVAGPNRHVDHNLLRTATNMVIDKMLRMGGFGEKRTYTFAEAVRGVPGDDYVRPLNRATSPGYPYVLHTKKKGKKDFFGEMDWELDTPEAKKIEDRVENMMDLQRKGQRPIVIFMDTLKDERRPIEKVRQGKTRLFSVGPLDYLIALRRYTLGFVAALMGSRIYNSVAIGIDPHAYEWNALAQYIVQVGDNVVAGDYTNFDGSLQQDLLWAVYDVIAAWYGESVDPGLKTAWLEILSSVHLSRDQLYQWSHSHPSGHALTSVVNSIANLILVKMAWLKVCPWAGSMDAFDKHVRVVVYGDDNVMGISSLAIRFFNQNTIAQAMESFHMAYTDESKTGKQTPDARKLEEVTFLKRHFRWEVGLNRYVGPLMLSTVLEMTNWMRESADPRFAFESVLNSACTELQLHPRSTAAHYLSALTKSCADKYKFGPQTWDIVRCGGQAPYHSRDVPWVGPPQEEGPVSTGIVAQMDGKVSIDVNQTMQFEHHGETVAAPTVERPEPVRRQYTRTGEDAHHGISSFLGRPCEISSTDWSSTQTVGTQLMKFVFPDILLKRTNKLDKLHGLNGFRATVVLRLMVNATPMQAGRLLLAYRPFDQYMPGRWVTINKIAEMSTTSLGGKDREHVLAHFTGCPSVELDLAEGTVAELRMPYVAPHLFYNLHTGEGTFGTAFVFVYGMLDSASSGVRCSVTAMAHFEDVELGYPSAYPAKVIDGAAKVTAQMDAEEKRDPPLAQDKQPRSGIIPKGLRTAGDLAEYFGFDKPRVPAGPVIVKETSARNMATGDGADGSDLLGLHVGQKLSPLPGFAGSSEDEMKIAHIASRPCFVRRFEWRDSSPAGTELSRNWVSPADGKPAIAAGYFKGVSIPTLLAYVSSPFLYWRGTIRYTFKLVKTRFHSGRLRVVFSPAASDTIDFSFEEYAYTKIVDISLISEFTVDCPFIATRPWLSLGREAYDLNHGGGSQSQYHPYRHAVGVLRITALSKLIAAPQVSNVVTLIQEISGGADFQVAGYSTPRLIPFLYYKTYVTGDVAPATTVPAPTLLDEDSHGLAQSVGLVPSEESFEHIQGETSRRVMRQLRSRGPAVVGQMDADVHHHNVPFIRPNRNATHEAAEDSQGEIINSVREPMRRMGLKFVADKLTTPLACNVFGVGDCMYPYGTATGNTMMPPDGIDYFGMMFGFWRGSVRIKVAGGLRYSATAYHADAWLSARLLGNDTGRWRDALAGLAAAPHFATLLTGTNRDLPCPRTIACLGQQGMMEIQVPYVSGSVMSPCVNILDMSVGFVNGGNHPGTMLELSMPGPPDVVTNGMWVEVYRGAGDDYQLGYLLGAPSCVKVDAFTWAGA